MSLLHGRIVLITDSGDPLGRAAAFATSRAGAQLVVNDPVGSGTLKSAADAMVYTIQRRGGVAISSGSDTSRFRQCIPMIQLGFDRWDWISGIVHVDHDNGASLQNILRAAAHPMKQWGGTLVVLNASDAAVGIIKEQAESLREGRLLVNAVRPTDEFPESLVLFLMSPEAIRENIFGQVVPPCHNLSPEEITAQIHSILADANKKPAAKAEEKPAAKAEKPAAKAEKPAAKAEKPAAKAEEKPVAKAEKPAAKAKPARSRSKAKASKPAAEEPAAEDKPAAKPARKRSTRKKSSTAKKASTTRSKKSS